MQKRNLSIALILGIFLISFVSAYTFSLTEMLDNLDPSTVILGTMFIVVFALLNYAFSKVFSDNKSIGGIISFAMSMLMVWGVNDRGLNLEDLFFDFGLSSELIYAFAPWVLLGGIIYLLWDPKRRVKSLLLLGIFFIILAFMVDATGVSMFIGLVFLGIGIWMSRSKKKKRSGSGAPEGYESYS